MITYCDCSGKHVPDCALGKRLKIKYHPSVGMMWNLIGGEKTEEFIDQMMEF